jgi:hypothetical protein
MDDLMPCDMAFTAFLESMTASRVLRATRPKFRGDELAIYREFRQVRRRGGSMFHPTKEQLQIAMVAIREERKAS